MGWDLELSTWQMYFPKGWYQTIADKPENRRDSKFKKFWKITRQCFRR